MQNPFDVVRLDAELEALLELDSDARGQRLAQIGAEDAARAAMLRRLLTAAESPTDPTDELRSGVHSSLRGAAATPEIPGYRIIGVIGSGGMATVYAAERDVQGAAQPVAIKVLGAAIGDRDSRERFLTEQRILARLSHPNIAALIDVGTIGERAWMALERVDGERIDERFAARSADVRAIVLALIEVCDALAVAHAHFIIHRDIKPANVLVERNGRVKLIDFGIAKVLADATLAANATATGLMPLTLRYASPEQLLNRPVGIASDVYQVGLLAAQLLTGRLPFEDEAGALASVRTQPGHLPLAPSRCVNEPALRRALSGDLDSIILRCLRFEPGERYPGIHALGDDLRRFLAHEPVQARRHTRGYLLRSFVLRHRLGVAMAAASGVLVLIASVSAFVLSARSQAHAQRVERILDSVTTMFARANPYADDAQSITVAEAVATTAQRFLSEEDADPEFQVLMLERLAELSTASGKLEDAAKLIEHAHRIATSRQLDADLRDRVRASLADALFERGDYDAIDRLVGADDLGRRDDSGLRLRYVVAKVANERGELEKASQAYEQLLADLAGSTLKAPVQSLFHTSHGVLLRRLGRFDDAIAAYRKGESLLDPDDLTQQEDLTAIRMNIAIAYGASGRNAESDRAFSQLLNDLEARLGREHAAVWSLARNYATLLVRTQRFAGAHALLNRYPHARSDTRANELRRASFLEGYSGTAFYNGEVEQGIDAILRAIELQRRIVGREAPALAGPLDWAAWMLFEIGEHDRAVALAAGAEVLRGSASDRGKLVRALATGPAEPAPELAGPCERREFSVLHGLLVQGQAPTPAPLPDACWGAPAARLVALGAATWPAAAPDFPREPLASPGIRRWLAPAAQRQVWPLPEARLAAIDALIASLPVATADPATPSASR